MFGMIDYSKLETATLQRRKHSMLAELNAIDRVLTQRGVQVAQPALSSAKEVSHGNEQEARTHQDHSRRD